MVLYLSLIKSLGRIVEQSLTQSNFFAIFCPFCDIISDMQFIAAYYTQLCNIMQDFKPIKLWTVIAEKTAVHDNKVVNMRRYIAADYSMLHNVVYFFYVMLHNFASGGEIWLGSCSIIVVCSSDDKNWQGRCVCSRPHMTLVFFSYLIFCDRYRKSNLHTFFSKLDNFT